MAGTSTIPAIDFAAPTKKTLSVSAVDARDGVLTESYTIPAAATAAQVGAMLTAGQAMSNASFYLATIRLSFIGVKSKSNAVSAGFQSATDVGGISVVNHAAGISDTFYVPALVEALAEDGAYDPDTDDNPWTVGMDAFLNLKGAGYIQNGVFFSDRRGKRSRKTL